MSNFLKDAERARIYEEIEAFIMDGKVVSGKNDPGYDVYVKNDYTFHDMEYKIDVKAHELPLLAKRGIRPDFRFNYVFLELVDEFDHPGWFQKVLMGESPATHFTFYTATDGAGNWEERYLVWKEDLLEAFCKMPDDEIPLYNKNGKCGYKFPLSKLKEIAEIYEVKEDA